MVGGCEQLQQHEQLLLQPHAHGGHGQLQHEPQLHGGQGDDEGILVAADGEEQQANGLGQPFQLLLMVVVVVVVVEPSSHPAHGHGHDVDVIVGMPLPRHDTRL